MSLRVGLNANPAELPAVLGDFPGIASCRVFGGPGSGIPSWLRNSAMVNLRKAGVLPWVSFKDWTVDSVATTAVNAWLDAMPADVPEAWLTYNHEPEGDLASREYRRRWTLLAKTVRAHKASSRIKLVPIHTLYPSRHKIGDRFNTDWTQWTGVWQQWAPTDSAGRYVGDFMGWDCYLETTATSYETPESFLRIPIGAAHQAGVPLVIPELGALRTPTDSTGTGRAEWITACLAHLAARQAQAVNWWHATGSGGHDYRLDAPARTAWINALTTNKRLTP